ncbi:MAG: TSUP family transporter, partial [Rhizobiales bacterium]|nr:TSUP family transporter [Hyphomicrobiales bacterium]
MSCSSITAPCALVLALVGLGTGFLSGLLGVGGGFLIVPALVLVTRMGVHRAVATSLLVISVIGVSGAATAISADEPPIELEITDVLDLHSFQPREMASVVREYLDAACERG